MRAHLPEMSSLRAHACSSRPTAGLVNCSPVRCRAYELDIMALIMHATSTRGGSAWLGMAGPLAHRVNFGMQASALPRPLALPRRSQGLVHP